MLGDDTQQPCCSQDRLRVHTVSWGTCHLCGHPVPLHQQCHPCLQSEAWFACHLTQGTVDLTHCLDITEAGQGGSLVGGSSKTIKHLLFFLHHPLSIIQQIPNWIAAEPVKQLFFVPTLALWLVFLRKLHDGCPTVNFSCAC